MQIFPNNAHAISAKVNSKIAPYGGYSKMSGIVRRIDTLGRLVIPKEMRAVLGIKPNDPVNFFLEQDKVIVTKYSEDRVEQALRLCGEEIERAISNRTICVVDDKYVYGVLGDETVSAAVAKLAGRYAKNIEELPIKYGDTVSKVNYTPIELKGISCGIIAPINAEQTVSLVARVVSAVLD